MTLRIPDLPDDTDTLTAALAYAEAGWYVLPVRRAIGPGGKHAGSVVGKNWPAKSSRDPQQLAAWFAGTDHSIVLHVGRSGAVAFDVDRPNMMPEELFWHTRNTTFQNTRPDEPERGHYVFATPPGMTFGNGGGQLGNKFGEVRGANGVILVAPHPDGRRWTKTGPVATLPDQLAGMLPKRTGDAEAVVSDAAVEAFLNRHETGSRPTLLAAHRKFLTGQIEAGASRHNTAVRVAVWAMEEAAAGYLHAREAADTLGGIVRNAWGLSPDARTPARAAEEWGGILAWAVAQALAADLDKVRARVQQRMPDNVTVIETGCGATETNSAAFSGPATPGIPGRAFNVEGIEDGFWDARVSLKTVYTAALSRLCSPWAVLGAVVARALAAAPPGVELPALIGRGSLNWFCAVAAGSGLGKSAAVSLAGELLPNAHVPLLGVGSGEGMLEAYRKPADPDTGEPAGVRPSILFDIDEVDALTATRNRSGSTVMSVLRSAFTGGRLGFTTKASSGFHVPANSYRMVLVLGVQPARAGAILDDHGGGTPQRFMWFPGVDGRITADPPGFPGTLYLPTDTDMWRYGATLTIPDEATALIRSTRAAAARGEGDPLESHALFVREKFAYGLAAVDGRAAMTSEDWELAGIAMKVSAATRGWVAAERVKADVAAAVEEGRVQGVKRAAADEEKTVYEAQRRNRVASVVVEKLVAAGPGGLTEGELVRGFNSRDRRLVGVVLPILAADGHVVRVDRLAGDRTDRWSEHGA